MMTTIKGDLQLDWDRASRLARFIEEGLNGGELWSLERVASITDVLCRPGLAIVADGDVMYLRVHGAINLEPGIAWKEGDRWMSECEDVRRITSDLTGLDVVIADPEIESR